MKFSSSVAVVSFLAAQALLVAAHPLEGSSPRGSLRARQGNFGFGKGKFGFGNKGAASAAAATTTTTTAAASTNTNAAASAAAASAAAAGTNNAAAAAAAAAAGAGKTGKGKGKGKGGQTNTTTTAAASTSTTAAAAVDAANNGANNNGNLQTSLQLDPKLIGSNLAATGQSATSEPGQVASLTSTNNFINFCDIGGQTITNGLQAAGGSCNPVPMGQIPAKANVPTCKFVFPANGQTVPANKNFTIQLAIQGMETGNFVNPDTNYFAAPQQLSKGGQIVGHSHVVVEKLTSLGQTTPNNPNVFAFFKGLNAAAVNGVLSTVVSGGLPAGAYKVSSINTAANHQPVLGPVAQHASFDDVSYFTVQ